MLKELRLRVTQVYSVERPPSPCGQVVRRDAHTLKLLYGARKKCVTTGLVPSKLATLHNNERNLRPPESPRSGAARWPSPDDDNPRLFAVVKAFLRRQVRS